MRSVYILFVIAIVIHVSAAECCPEENCMAASNCEALWIGAECPDSQQTCCSIVKKEYRNACRHHGGECMKNCNKNLQRTVSDCPAQTVCCVLV